MYGLSVRGFDGILGIVGLMFCLGKSILFTDKWVVHHCQMDFFFCPAFLEALAPD